MCTYSTPVKDVREDVSDGIECLLVQQHCTATMAVVLEQPTEESVAAAAEWVRDTSERLL